MGIVYDFRTPIWLRRTHSHTVTASAKYRFATAKWCFIPEVVGIALKDARRIFIVGLRLHNCVLTWIRLLCFFLPLLIPPAQGRFSGDLASRPERVLRFEPSLHTRLARSGMARSPHPSYPRLYDQRLERRRAGVEAMSEKLTAWTAHTLELTGF